MRVLYPISLYVLFLLLAGCNKKEHTPTPEDQQILTHDTFRDWQLEKVTYKFMDVSGQIPACQIDEIYRFYADGRGKILSGPEQCQDNEPVVQSSGTWHFTDSRTKLYIDWQQKKNWEATINELEPDKLVVTGDVFDGYVVTATFRPLK